MAKLNSVGVDTDVLRNTDGKYRTTSLFYEYRHQSKEAPVYTLVPDSKLIPVPSLHKLYVDIGDPTEYMFAKEAFGSWEHWQRLAGEDGPDWFKPHLERMRRELDVKLKSEAVRSLYLDMKSGVKTDAAKFFAKGEFRVEPKRKAGRPSKEEVIRERKLAAESKAELDADAERMGLDVDR